MIVHLSGIVRGFGSVQGPTIHTIPVLQKWNQEPEWYDIVYSYSTIGKNVKIHRQDQNTQLEDLFPNMKIDIGSSNQADHDSSPVQVTLYRANGMGGSGREGHGKCRRHSTRR